MSNTDTLALTAILTSTLSLVLSILTHVKKSKCCGGECQTRRLSAPDTPTTPLLSNNVQHSSPIPIPSQIPIKRVYL
jgi:hypothetical protein